MDGGTKGTKVGTGDISDKMGESTVLFCISGLHNLSLCVIIYELFDNTSKKCSSFGDTI